MELNQQRIEDAVIEEVAERLISEEKLQDYARKAIVERVEKLWKNSAENVIQDTVNTAIREGFDHEYQKVSSFGQPEGQKTTIKKELEKLIHGYWAEKVDEKGKPVSGWGSDKALTRAEWVMASIVVKDFNENMKQHTVNIGGALKDQLRGSLHDTVNRLLSEVFNVKSLEEQSEKRPRGVPSVETN